jgi:hypothetical protein
MFINMVRLPLLTSENTARESKGHMGWGGWGLHAAWGKRWVLDANFPLPTYLVLRDTLCSCEAYGMRPTYQEKSEL